MTKDLSCASGLCEILRNQISALSNLYACQKRMFTAVLERDWVNMEAVTLETDRLSGIFADLEEARTTLIRSFFPDADASRDFYSISTTFEEKERKLANSLFREMKQLLLLCRTENDVFTVHVQNARSIVKSVVENCLPDRPGKIYGRNGSPVHIRMDSLVLNRSF